jgi:ADP-heptose:LPS heptosyltransferase
LGTALTDAASSPRDWRRGLILSHSHIGDVLYRTCSLDALADGLPECRWSYLVTPQGAELLQGNAAVEALPLLSHGSRHPAGPMLQALAQRKFDVVLCTNTFQIGRDLRLGLRLRIANRVAFTFKGWRGLVTHAAPVDFPSPYAAYFAGMVAAVTGARRDWPLRPVIRWSEEDRARARQVLDELRIAGDFVVCAPGTRQPGAATAEVFARVLRSFQDLSDMRILVAGAPNEYGLLDAVASAVGTRATVLRSALDLGALACLFSHSSAALTQDSGPRHLATAARTPVVFFRNLVVPRIETGVYCAGETDLSPPDELLSPEAAVRAHEQTDARTAALTLRAAAERAEPPA